MRDATHEEGASKKKKRRPCQRCGNFAKRARLGDRRWCLDCLKRADPIERDRITAGSLASATFALAARAAPRLLVPALGYALLTAVLQHQFAESPVASLLGTVLGFVWAIGLVSMRIDLALAIVEGRPLPPMGELVAAVTRRFGSIFRLQLMCSLAVLGWSLLLVVPGIMRALDLMLAPEMLVLEGHEETSVAMNESTVRVRGHRMTLALTSMIVLGAPMALIVAVGFLRLGPEVQMGMSVLLSLCITVSQFASSALYFKLRWAAALEKLAPSST